MSKRHRTGMFWVVWGIVLVLAIIHQDFWYWDDRTLVFGFLPIGLFYHALLSVACAVTWALAVKFAWPHHIEEWADEFENESDDGAAS